MKKSAESRKFAEKIFQVILHCPAGCNSENDLRQLCKDIEKTLAWKLLFRRYQLEYGWQMMRYLCL
jgi:hypothetical protein